MKTRLLLLVILILATAFHLSAQWKLASAGYDALVYGFLEHRGILFDHEDIGPAVWRSTDHGVHWVVSDTGLPHSADVLALGHVDSVVLAADYRGRIYRSTNNGSSWVFADSIPVVQSLTNIGNWAFAGTRSGVWSSIDLGVTWQATPNLYLTDTDVHAIRSYEGKLFAGTPSGIFRSSNGGTKWTFLSGSPRISGNEVWATDGQRFAVLDSGLHFSTDAGDTWSVTRGIRASSVLIFGDYIFASGTTPQVRYTTDKGLSWTDVSANLPDFNFWPYGPPWVCSMIVHNNQLIVGCVLTSIFYRPLSEMIDIPVAVQLSSFRYLKGALEWTTLSEIDNYGFYVQYRTETSQTFKDVDGAFVPGHQTTTTPQSYSYRLSGSPGCYRLRQVDLDGTNHFSDEVLVSADQLTGIGVNEQTPTTFGLGQNYPNPFNPTTAISYQLAAISDVKLEVFDLLGCCVATLVNEKKEAGTYTVRWNAGTASSGMYYCRLTAGSFVQTRRMILLR